MLVSLMRRPSKTESHLKLIGTIRAEGLICNALVGVRQYHFPIYYDPMGTNYTSNSGLKIANQSANVSAEDPKWGYPGEILDLP